MKAFLFNILVVGSLCLRSQSILFPNDGIDWGHYPSHEQTRLALIKEINKSLGNKVGTLPGGRVLGNLSDYYVFDVTEDGLLDIIYSGPYGEGNAVIIFENRNGHFIQSDAIPGELTGLRRMELSRTIEIQTHSYPCCAGSLHSIRVVVVNSTPKKVELITLSKIDFIEGTADLIHSMNPVIFETVNPEYRLRATPQILNDYDLGIETIDGSNTVATYPSGSIGSAVGKTVDDTGRIWWMVIMKNNLKPIKTLMYYNNDSRGSESIGWMSSNFVKVIEAKSE
ncbi:MAG: hypothetical protein ABJN36_15215 [Cyclobacteriaceae bacterium]